MKKFLTSLVIISLVIVMSSVKVDAQTTTPSVPTNLPNATNTVPSTQANSYDCSSINSISDYNICCAPNGGGTSAQCNAYEQSNPALTSVPGQISSGGTPTTNPINNGISSNLGGSNTGNANVQDVASTCSAIQFLTIIAIAIWVKCIIGTIVIPGIFTLAFAIFLWGVLKFIRASDKADKDDSKQFIYMGLIGLFVMTSVWGIIKIFTTTLGVDTVVPTLQTDYLTNSSSSSTSQ